MKFQLITISCEKKGAQLNWVSFIHLDHQMYDPKSSRPTNNEFYFPRPTRTRGGQAMTSISDSQIEIKISY